jgi:hypothetical protein
MTFILLTCLISTSFLPFWIRSTADMAAAIQRPNQAIARPSFGARPGVAQSASDEFCGFIKRLSSDYDAAADPSRLLRYRKWSKSDLYLRGNHLIFFDEQYNSYLQLPSGATDLHHVVNYFASTLETLATEYSKSKPQLTAYSRAGDGQRVQESVDTAQFLIECLRSTLFPMRSLQREAYLVLLRGGVFTRVYVDRAAGQAVEVPQYGLEQRDVSPGQFWCPHCGGQGQVNEQTQQCPQCGNGPVQVQSNPIQAQSLMRQGGFKVPAGEIRRDPIDPYEVDIADRATGPWDSPYLRWDCVKYKSELAEEFQDWDMEAARGSAIGVNADKLVGLQWARQLELECGNLGNPDQNYSWSYGVGRLGSNSAQLVDKLTAVRSQLHYRVGVYRDKVFDNDVFLPGIGKVIPKRTKCGEVFPHGLTAYLINGEAVKVADKCLDDEWDGYTVTVPTRGFYGNGAEQFVAIQDWINDAVSLAITMGMMTASGILVMDKDRYEGATGKPGDILTMLDRQLGEAVGDGIEHIAISGDHGQVQSLLAMSKADMVNVSGARSPDWGGEPSQTPGKQLATGINYNNAIASAVAGMKLDLRAENFAHCTEQGLRIISRDKDYVTPRYWRMLDDQKGRWLRGYDIGHDIAVRVEEDSAQPLTSLERRANLVAAHSQMGYGIVDGNGKPANPAWKERLIAKRFNLEQDPDASDNWATIAYRRIDAMMETAEMAGKYAMQLPPDQAKQFLKLQILRAGLERNDYDLSDPQALMPSHGDRHLQLVDAYQLFFETDEYRHAPLPVKEVIEMLLPLHFAAEQKDEVAKQLIVKQLAAPLQPPPPPPDKPKQSISLKDALAVPGAAEQMLAEVGIKVAPMGQVGQDDEGAEGEKEQPSGAPPQDAAALPSPMPPIGAGQPPPKQPQPEAIQ